jgi:hypothetical protein|uniref:Uncharacterized protein n=1 Tax=Picea glauca TaxID=3330 RepID=A0A101LZI0_PICGL|nr:hypothetical protein ABT39_MTgene5118 [Picea glauca]
MDYSLRCPIPTDGESIFRSLLSLLFNNVASESCACINNGALFACMENTHERQTNGASQVIAAGT